MLQAKGEAKAFAIRAKAEADAEAMAKKAEAWRDYQGVCVCVLAVIDPCRGLSLDNSA